MRGVPEHVLLPAEFVCWLALGEIGGLWGGHRASQGILRQCRGWGVGLKNEMVKTDEIVEFIVGLQSSLSDSSGQDGENGQDGRSWSSAEFIVGLKWSTTLKAYPERKGMSCCPSR